MKLGFIGLGKLGLPVALAVEDKGHRVAGIDIDENLAKKHPYKEREYGGAWDTVRRADGSVVKP